MKFVYAVAILSGTIIGVGLFALPYITLKVGFWLILAYFLILGVLVFLIHLFFAELALITPDFKRLPGFARIHLGKWAERITYCSTIVGIIGALLAYMIVGGEFLLELLSPVLGGNLMFYVFCYFVIGACLIFFGIKAIAQVQFWGLILFFIILFSIFSRGNQFFSLENVFNQPDYSYLFLPYGVVLFSLWGVSLIPEIEEMLAEKKKIISKIIPVAIFIPIVVYLFFAYFILGITGSQTTDVALTGLKNVLDNGVVVLALCFGTLTTFTTFIALGLTLKKVLWYDLNLSKNLAWFITCFSPFFLFLLGFKEFVFIISFIGAVFLGIEGILILMMYKKAVPAKTRTTCFKKKLVLPLILILLGGIVYQIIYFMK
jgi:tyrosine-specific transport protein